MLSETSPLLPVSTEYIIPYKSLSLKEIQEYSNKPLWVLLRKFLIILTGVAWIGLIGLSLSIAFSHNGCSNTHQSQDVTREGIRSKMDYLSSLKIDAIWLSPVYKSPMKDFGYDVSDFKDIDPTFGTLDDFKQLAQELKSKGIRIIMDFVPNHTSDEHEWFLKSCRREEPYTDYYVWAKPKNLTAVNNTGSEYQAPNNWLSVFGGSAWQFHPGRQEFYLHQFAKEQPDLNFRNPAVLKEMQGVLEFWLKLGVSGFRVDAAPHIMEDELLRDEPRSEHKNATPEEYDYLKHIHTHGLEENLNIVMKFRETLDTYTGDLEPKLLMAEVYDSMEETSRWYGTKEHPIADFPFNFLLVGALSKEPSANELKKLVEKWMDHLPEAGTANWVLGNHDKSRIASRLGGNLIDAMNMICLLLPGVSVTYYGEEIGMEDVTLSWEQTVDPAGRNAGPMRYVHHSRDPQRSPMQWSEKTQAEFSTSTTTWLPVHENHKSGISVSSQETNQRSHLNVFRSLMNARDSEAIRHGTLDVQVLSDDQVFTFIRQGQTEAYLVAVNFGSNNVTTDLRQNFPSIPEEATIYTCNSQYTIEPGKKLNTSCVSLGPRDAMVLTFQTMSSS